jgi:catechol 2,3-dioxygenase-like lactoylglutathione lyase family enzyme
MTISLLYGCFQVELSVRDLAAARRFLEGVLGGRPIEQQLAGEITALFPRGGYRVEHVDCGDATFQVNEASAAARYGGNKLVHQEYQETLGPCVSNLNFYVDDIEHARALLSEHGAATRIEGPSTAVHSLTDYGDNTRPGGEKRQFLFIRSRPLIGLDLEIMEPNFVRFVDQTVQQPCFVRPGATTPATQLRLERLRLVVDDIEATYNNLVTLLSPASRSKPYGYAEGSSGRSFRIGLGGIELEYCEPAAAGTPLGEYLTHHGPGAVALEFSTSDPELLSERARASGLTVEPEVDLLGDGHGGRLRIESRAVVGFDVVLEVLVDPLARPAGHRAL